MTPTSIRFGRGTGLVLSGWRFLRHEKELWFWVGVPWLIDVAVLIAGWSIGLTLIQSLTAWAVAQVAATGWLFGVLYYPALLIFGFTFMIIWLLLIVAVATVIASPFTSVLAEKALRRQNIPTVVTSSWWSWAAHFSRMILIGLVKAFVFVTAGLILFVFSFIPGLNLAAVYGSMCLFAADVFDYSFEARGWGFRERMRELKKTSPEVAGLGVTLALTSLIPGLTILVLPIAVAGATTVMAERWRGDPR